VVDWLVDFWQTIDWAVVAQIMVALGTIALATVTVAIILQNRKWNKRNEQRRTTPFLGLSKTKGNVDITALDSKRPGWAKSFFLTARNIGLGPILYHCVTAKQGTLEYKARITTPAGCLSNTLAVNQKQTLLFERKNGEIPVSDTDNHIEVDVILRDLYANVIEIKYMVSLLDKDGKRPNRISEIEVLSVSINGKKMIISELVSKYDGV